MAASLGATSRAMRYPPTQGGRRPGPLTRTFAWLNGFTALRERLVAQFNFQFDLLGRSSKRLLVCFVSGDAIIFTEKLVHGTLPWRGRGERRTLFYKYLLRGIHMYRKIRPKSGVNCAILFLYIFPGRYVPWGVHWRDGVYDTSAAAGLSAEQIALVAPPAVYYTPRWFGIPSPGGRGLSAGPAPDNFSGDPTPARL